jgi:hypothetical protein
MKIATILIASFALSTVAEARIHRSHVPIHAFVKANACPTTGQNRLPCPGYVIDHIEALACGGLDHQSNMQWQTIAESKAKDKWERKGCKTSSAKGFIANTQVLNLTHRLTS